MMRMLRTNDGLGEFFKVTDSPKTKPTEQKH
jgi:hypothetical protein